MSSADLKSLARLGEGYHLEFKRRVSTPMRIAREAIAFANTWGGKLLVGVSDDGQVVGVKDVAEELYDIEQAMNDCCEPEIAHTIHTVPITARREVIVINIPESKSKPHFLRHPASPAPEAFIRIQDQTISASDEVLALLETEKDQGGVKFEFGDKELLLLRYLEEYHRVSVAQYSRLAEISTTEASKRLVLLTRANVLQIEPSDKEDTFVFCYHAEAAAVSNKGWRKRVNNGDTRT
jgi:predicted HTH transcriptional regulator